MENPTEKKKEKPEPIPDPSYGKKSVMFVCLGNICRSPIAYCIMKHLVKEKNLLGWTIDSSATSAWHEGKSPDSRARQVLEAHGVISRCTAKQIKRSNFSDFHYILGMDEDNVKELEKMAPPNTPAVIELLGNFDPQGERLIRDPYYDNDTAGFEQVYEQCYRCCAAFLDKVEKSR